MKIVNRRILALVLMFLPNVLTFAQQKKEIKNSEVDGIYLILDDFKSGKLTRPTDKLHKGDKINLRQFFISPKIISIELDEENVLYKDSIFAIRLTNGDSYRFINRLPSFVADSSYLYIYTLKTTITEYKMSGPHSRSNEIPITYFYFSFGDHKTVYELTLENLRKICLSNSDVHIAVCNKFTTDKMLTEMNTLTERFVLNETILSVVKK